MGTRSVSIGTLNQAVRENSLQTRAYENCAKPKIIILQSDSDPEAPLSRGGVMRPTISSQNKINGGPGKLARIQCHRNTYYKIVMMIFHSFSRNHIFAKLFIANKFKRSHLFHITISDRDGISRGTDEPSHVRNREAEIPLDEFLSLCFPTC